MKNIYSFMPDIQVLTIILLSYLSELNEKVIAFLGSTFPFCYICTEGI